jgi:hypothetical protein
MLLAELTFSDKTHDEGAVPVICVNIDVDIDLGVNVGEVVVVLESLSVTESPGTKGVVGSLADGLTRQ